MPLPAVREHTDAVIATLAAAGLAVGDAKAPAGDPPYDVVYSIPAGGWTGTLAAPNDDGSLVYQVSCVGKSRQQAEWLADKAIATILGGVAVTGRSVPFVELDLSGGVSRDDDRTPPLWVAAPRFRFATTPA
jgi:hypothetical protein